MYQNGKIYKLVSDSTDKIYIGSTCNPLYKRLAQHKSANKNPNTKCYTAKELIKFDDCKIILIEDFQCERKEQLTARERYHIEQNKNICVNIQIPTRTSKEYYQQNKDKIIEQTKKYKQQNKDKLTEYQKEYYQQHRDKRADQNKEWYQQNKDKRAEYHKEYYQQNKDKRAEQMKEYQQQNKDKLTEYKKEYRQQNKDKHPEYYKEYYQQNKAKILERRRLKKLEQKNIELDNKEDGYTTT